MQFDVRFHGGHPPNPFLARRQNGRDGTERNDESINAINKTLYLDSLSLAIDQVQGLFNQWEAQGAFAPPISADMVDRARLAVHEWIACLARSATFGQTPRVTLCLWVYNGKFWGLISDNSMGMDTSSYPTLDTICEDLPEEGWGLSLIKVCVDRFVYCSQLGKHQVPNSAFGEQQNLLAFSVVK